MTQRTNQRPESLANQARKAAETVKSWPAWKQRATRLDFPGAYRRPPEERTASLAGAMTKPAGPKPSPTATIVKHEVLGGLHHEYEWATWILPPHALNTFTWHAVWYHSRSAVNWTDTLRGEPDVARLEGGCGVVGHITCWHECQRSIIIVQPLRPTPPA